MGRHLVPALPLLVMAVAALSGCGHGKAASDTRVSWTRAVDLVRTCQARRVDQTHSRLVTVTLRNRSRVFTREPQIDAVIPFVNKAIRRCGPITFSTE